MALTIPIENIDFRQLRQKIAEERRLSKLISQGFAPPEGTEGFGPPREFVPPAEPAPLLALEDRTPTRVPTPPTNQGPPQGFGTPMAAPAPTARGVQQPQPTPQPVTPLGGEPVGLPFTDIPPETSEDKIRALIDAGIVQPPEQQTLPIQAILGSIAVPQPVSGNLEILESLQKSGFGTYSEALESYKDPSEFPFQPFTSSASMELEAQRQADVRREEGRTIGDAIEAIEHVAQPFDVLGLTAWETISQVPRLLTLNFEELEPPTLFSSGLNFEEGFRNSRDKFLSRPGWQQVLIGALDPTIIVPFFKVARTAAILAKLVVVARTSTRVVVRGQGGGPLISGVRGLPISPPPRSLAQKMQEQAQLFSHFGMQMDASANEFLAPLRPMVTRIGEVITTEHPLLKVILGQSGINPQIRRNTTVGRAATAYQTGRIEAEELISVTLAAGFDFHLAQGLRARLGFTGRILPIDRKTGFFGDTGKLWQDVFSNPGNPEFRLTPAQRAMIDDYNQISNFEIPRILEDAGITQRMRSRPEGQYYVFRDVQEIRGIETRRHSDDGLQRHYDEATEGFETAGIRYDTDPRRSLEFQLRWALNKVLRKQLDDVLEPLSVTRIELVPEAIRNARTNILREIMELENTDRAIRGMIRTTGVQSRVAAVRTGERTSRMVQLQGEVDRLDDVLADLPVLQAVETEAVRVELTNARGGARTAEILLNRTNREIARARENLARVSGKAQGTVEELGRLEKQFDRLALLQDQIAIQPISQLLRGQAPIPGSVQAIRQAAARSGNFGAISAQITRAERATVGAQRRLVNLDNARTQLRVQVARLTDDVKAGRELTHEARGRLRSATSGAIQRERARGRTVGVRTQAQRQQVRGARQLITRARRVANAEAMEFDIQVRRSILSSHLDNVEQQLIRARVRKTAIKQEYDNEFARTERANVAPGALFGPNQPLEIGIADWRKRFFTRADADLLKAQLENLGIETLTSKAVKGFEVLGNSIRFLSAFGDFAMPFIQGLLVLGTNPAAWARMSLRHYQAFFDPTVQARLIRDNIEDFQWLARHGVPIGDPEFFRALEAGQGFSPGRLLELLPKGEEARHLFRVGGKQFFGRFAASYNTGLGWSRALLYKSLKDSWKGTDAELARYIRNLTGGLDSRALGVAPGQRAAEGMWLAFSPRLLRSTIALTVDAFKPGTVVGRNSLRSLAQLATGATILYVLTGLALRKDWDEIFVGLNPLNGKRYLSHQINGDWIGVGGQVRAISQVMYAALVDPVSFISLNRFDNPFIGLVSSRGAPITGIAEAVGEAVTGRDFAPFDEIDGVRDLAKHIGTSALPFVVQGYLEGEGLEATVAAFLGARTSAETVFEKEAAGQDRVRTRLVASGVLPESTVGVEWRELDLDYQRLVDEQPEMEPLLKAVAELQAKRNRPIQIMTNELDEIDKDHNTLLAETADQLGPGKAFRIQLGILERDLSRDKDAERKKHSDALRLIEEFEPSEAAFQIALTAYMDALNTPGLENLATGEYDFDLREQVLDKVREDHTDGMIDRVEVFLRDDSDLRAISPEAADMVKQLDEDRVTLRPYWDQIDLVIGWQSRADQRIYRGYQGLSPTAQKQMTTWVDSDSMAVRNAKENNRLVVNAVQKAINDRLERTRLGNRDIRDALVRQEYTVTKQLIRIQAKEAEREAVGVTP